MEVQINTDGLERDEIYMTVNPVEMIVINNALRKIINDVSTNKIDAEIARRMLGVFKGVEHE